MKVNESYILNCLNQHVLNWLTAHGLGHLKDQEIDTFNPESYPDELDVLIKHLEYSVRDITEYQYLTEREQQIISKGNFKNMFLSPEEEHKQQILQGARQEMAETLQKLLNEGFDEPDLQKLLDNLAADIPVL